MFDGPVYPLHQIEVPAGALALTSVPVFTVTEARRRASQAYKERQEREGIKVVSVRLNCLDREFLKSCAVGFGASQAEIVSAALQVYKATNAAFGVLQNQQKE